VLTLTYEPRIAFGRHLAALRRSKGFSQEGLALESGLARSYLGGVERGQRNIALVNICKLAQAMSVAPSEVMAFDVPHAVIL
jgi:transcriptional regulator with XRE-family HTH domain